MPLMDHESQLRTDPPNGEPATKVDEDGIQYEFPYEILQSIAQGGYASIYLAQDPQVQRSVAIKMLRREFADKQEYQKCLINEGRFTASIAHNHVPTIFGVGRWPSGTPWIAMEHLRGGSVLEVTKKLHVSMQTKPDPENVIRTFRPLLTAVLDASRAVEFVHASKQKLHADIKPANILLQPVDATETRTKGVLIDWGLASALETENSEPIATPHYSSPEQAGSGLLTAQTDVFGMGATLYEIMTNHPPLEGSTKAEVLERALRCDVTPLDSKNVPFPAELIRVCVTAMDKNRESRFPDCAAFRKALRNVVQKIR